jgi:hypothetical protein
VFCGNERLASIEDVMPKWVRKALALSSPVTIRAGSSGATAHTQHLLVTLRDMVCENCNNRWMSALENRVSKFLAPMLTNQHGTDLDLTQQRDLARWAAMKVLLQEHSMRQQHPGLRTSPGYVPTEPELAWLYTHDDPPPRSKVWLGAFDAAGRIAVTTQARLVQSAPVPGGGSPVPGHMTTLTVGCVLLQVFTTNFVLADAQALPAYDASPPQPYNRALARIWPSDHPVVAWPPELYVTEDVLDKVVNWGQPTRT